MNVCIRETILHLRNNTALRCFKAIRVNLILTVVVGQFLCHQIRSSAGARPACDKEGCRIGVDTLIRDILINSLSYLPCRIAKALRFTKSVAKRYVACPFSLIRCAASSNGNDGGFLAVYNDILFCNGITDGAEIFRILAKVFGLGIMHENIAVSHRNEHINDVFR